MFKPTLLCAAMLSAAAFSGVTSAATATSASNTSSPTSASTKTNLQQVKPMLKALSVSKPVFKAGENIDFTVQFANKQCVFNVEFKDTKGVVKSVGYYFKDASELQWAFSQPASYWGLNAGTYSVSAVPHQNAAVAGANAPACGGGRVSSSFTLEAPEAVGKKLLPPVKSGSEVPGQNKGASAKPGELLPAVKPGELLPAVKPGSAIPTDQKSKSVGAVKSDPPDPDKSKPAVPQVSK